MDKPGETVIMMGPQYLCCLYLATAGLQGNSLGSDEEEIILLVYVVVEVPQNKIVGVRQYLVKPQVADMNGNLLSEQFQTTSLLTEEMVQTAGQPLETVIFDFDRYLRQSLNLDPAQTNFRFVTDGQLPLRQCLHPESCSKNIELKSYYTLFYDLRKEVHKYHLNKRRDGLAAVAVNGPVTTNGGIPGALSVSAVAVPVDVAAAAATVGEQLQVPISIAEMLEPLGLAADVESEFYVKEAKDMVNIVQTLLTNGHRFENPETINLVLEPGICSKSDEIESNCVVRARGLPWQSSDQDIAKFFRGLNVAKGGVALCLSPQGRRNGEALIRFCSQEHRDMALKRHKHHIGVRYIEVYRANGEDFLAVAGGSSNEAQTFLSRGAAVIIRMRGLPYDCSAQQVLDFFSTGETPCYVLDGIEGVLFVKKPDGRATGDAFVLFANETDAPKALGKHRELIGSRYIELFRSTTAEVQQVLNRSMDPKTYEHQPVPATVPQAPLIAQIPQVPLLPQHIITSGTRKDCIRLRGLPYEAQVEHILEFLGEYAQNIVFQGVHMVYNSQGQPSGEAFIQMDCEKSAGLAAHQKHHRYMVFGKKQRYIEVFQCSGEDMNLVLTGGIPAPVSPSKGAATALLSPGILPAPPAAAGPPPAPTINTTVAQIQQNLVTPNPALNWENPALYAQQQAQMIAQQNLLIKQHFASAQLAALQAAAQQEILFFNPLGGGGGGGGGPRGTHLPQGLLPQQAAGLFAQNAALLPPNFALAQNTGPLLYIPGGPRLPAPPHLPPQQVAVSSAGQVMGFRPQYVQAHTAHVPPPPAGMLSHYQQLPAPYPPPNLGVKRAYGDAFVTTNSEANAAKRAANYTNNVYTTAMQNSQLGSATNYGHYY